MTTLGAIGFTVAGGSAIFLCSLTAFSFAVRHRSPKIAPRCTARPPNVIYNPTATPGQAQYRGHPFYGWVPWTKSLSYDTLLRGVPGTGTRNGGLAGTLLHVTLDGIVLLRFHAFGRRIATLATALCIFLLLPLYLTAPCLPDFYGNNHYMELYECNSTRLHISNYRTTTLSHVPDLQDGLYGTARLEYTAIMGRLYAVVICVWIITLYAFYLLKKEWVELVQLRRIYFLDEKREQQSYQSEWCKGLRKRPSYVVDNKSDGGDSIGDAENIEAATVAENNMPASPDSIDLEKEETSTLLSPPHNDNAEEDEHLTRRDPWIPHPEQPDTVPNVEPYSILLGHLPSLLHPTSIANRSSSMHSNNSSLSSDNETAQARVEQIQGQLQLITRLLEQALPQEPGYSSPVAAVTLIPCSHQVGLVWRKWYATATKMRRLDLIRQQIQQRRRLSRIMEKDLEAGASGGIGGPQNSGSSEFDNREEASPPSIERMARSPPQNKKTSRGSPVGTPSSPEEQSQSRNRTPNSVFNKKTGVKKGSLRRPSAYLIQALGPFSKDQDDLKRDACQLDGPEQTAVFSRELAQSASNCCPHGSLESRIYRATLDQLLSMELEAEIQLHKAKHDLDRARRMFLTSSESTGEGEPETNYECSSVCSGPAAAGISADAVSGGSGDFVLPTSRPSSPTTKGPAAVQTVEMSEFSLRGPAETTPPNVGSTAATADPSSSSPEAKSKSTTRGAEFLRATAAAVAPFAVHHPVGAGGVVRDIRNPRFWKWLLDEIRVKRCNIIPECMKGLAREHSYAVVTFTSRQAAAAARQCLLTADNNGNNATQVGRLMTLHDVPTPPLADAAAWKLLPCRYFCRPVTISLNNLQKNLRMYIVFGWLGFLYIFYTIPLTYAASQVDPDTIAYLFPEHKVFSKTFGVNIPDLVSGITSSIIWSLFFMLCPQVFKLTAYFGSKATSLAQAERRALQYFWWFMVLTAFTGPMLAYWILGAVNKGEKLGEGLRKVLIHLAGATPTLIAANWLNWIIYRFTIILPINFLLQFNTFLFSFLGWKCCSRVTIGGGPGGPVPYRIFVDSGVVLMCTVALGPASPLVAPAALAYFLFCEPLLRRNVIFVYRPRYDDGGLRWMFVFDMITSALVVGQMLLALQMGLKNALGPGLIATAAIPATIWFQWYCKRRYEPAFENTALLRTSLLDGWDSLDEMSMDRREEHRRFLIDAHKAAYIPVCIAGSESAAILTSTPAAVVPHSIDSDRGTPSTGASPPHTKVRRQKSGHGAPPEGLHHHPNAMVSPHNPNEVQAARQQSIENLQDSEIPSPFDGRLNTLFPRTAQKFD